MNVLLNVYICALRKNSAPLFPEGTIQNMYTPGTIANSHITPTKININGAVLKVKTLVKQIILSGIWNIWNNFSWNAGFTSYPMLMIFLVFGRCIQRNLLIFTFMNKHFFKSLSQKEAQGEIAAYEQYKFH